MAGEDAVNGFHPLPKGGNKKLNAIEKALKERGKLEYEKGVKDAMSVAVNIFNVEPEIREKVFKMIFENNNITTLKR